jgi:hypothetical protein
MRSRNGPEIRFWYRSGTWVAQVHDRSEAPANPHGHGFIAAMSWNRAGKVVVRPARAMATHPSSRG